MIDLTALDLRILSDEDSTQWMVLSILKPAKNCFDCETNSYCYFYFTGYEDVLDLNVHTFAART